VLRRGEARASERSERTFEFGEEGVPSLRACDERRRSAMSVVDPPPIECR
jgi:hypothetical protein